ncbi:predicted protein [Plenodomus lingam JN3]|uniref:Predicted protein n=1 Tax=Leptosphaeria maculans (strain JN3 / isolate v23.1.3 / race Av1-4-5-6-7-8) TaxID=985895 RepID=E4ZP47_LEPMJ|nr:predicted protein [Plenodomus lingam JN3]CBX93576.1 predicted protein [Plenodomus lingam JN3]
MCCRTRCCRIRGPPARGRWSETKTSSAEEKEEEAARDGRGDGGGEGGADSSVERLLSSPVEAWDEVHPAGIGSRGRGMGAREAGVALVESLLFWCGER